MVNKIIEVERTPKVIKFKRTHIPPRVYYYKVNNEVFVTLKELKETYRGYKIIIKDAT